MKALSIKQPLASLIAHGIKDIENRTWKTHFRGRIYIHASAKLATKSQHISLIELYQLGLTEEMIIESKKKGFNFNAFDKKHEWRKNGLIYSAIIGEVDIVDCVINHNSIWAEKTPESHKNYKGNPFDKPPTIYNWVLANPILYDKPILNVKGKLSFWEF